MRFIGHLNRNYPTIITVGRFIKWFLTVLKKNLFGIGGIFLLIIAGLYITGALIEPPRWYLIGIASALLLLSVGLIVLSYTRFILSSIINDQRKRISDIRKEVSELNKDVSNSKNMLAKTNVGNFSFFQPFNRQLTKQNLKHFTREWVPKLELDLDDRALAYIAHRICLAEDTCIGRLGANIETMLLRVLVARSIKESDLEVLEIGTLFGVSVAVINEYCRGFFNNVHISVIDPLSGYYAKGQLEPATKMPISRGIFVGNMQRMNIPESEYTIIEKLSTEEEAIKQASERCYNLLIIDGDHSYSGVKQDFNNYRHLLKDGGYIIFDDYGKTEWPGIKSFVDEEVVGLPGLELLGTDSYSAVFRVISAHDSTRP